MAAKIVISNKVVEVLEKPIERAVVELIAVGLLQRRKDNIATGSGFDWCNGKGNTGSVRKTRHVHKLWDRRVGRGHRLCKEW